MTRRAGAVNKKRLSKAVPGRGTAFFRLDRRARAVNKTKMRNFNVKRKKA